MTIFDEKLLLGPQLVYDKSTRFECTKTERGVRHPTGINRHIYQHCGGKKNVCILKSVSLFSPQHIM